MSSRNWRSRFTRRDRLFLELQEMCTPLELHPGDRITILESVDFRPADLASVNFLLAVVRRVSALTGHVHFRTLAPRAHGWLLPGEEEGYTFARGWLISERDQYAFLAARALEKT